MNLLPLGTAGREVFALHDPPAVRASRARAAVLCNPGGPELAYAHRALRHLALRLARRGLHVVRFDYFGTGDSGGDDAAVTLEGMRRDVAIALDAARDLSGADRVELVGLRLGANVAALAAAGSSAVGAVVLWDPLEVPPLPAGLAARVLHLVTEPDAAADPAVRIPGPRCWEEFDAATGALPVAAYTQIEAWLG